ncbi:MAG TPA: NAD/NADP octopine/nopaline dehydrogenase family protein [Candidatus Methylomirabilis sp.]|nr:NAD/NADP octopine/nopaline dehydrogenase family protein [Candidatus Methylomirabilis sp.]
MSASGNGTTCAVIGAGLGGCALVGAMGLHGYRMRLHDLDDTRLVEIRDRGGIEVDGLFNGFAAVEVATPRLAPAVDGADIIIVCTGSNKHAEVAGLLAPRLLDGQTILLVQGGTGGSLVVRNELRRAGCRADVDVSEMDNYPFSLAWPRPSVMNFTIRKEFLQIAALPAARGETVLAKLKAAFPQAVAAPNTLYTGLNNANGILHVANMVANIGRLESTGSGYRFYADGYTPSAVKILEQVSAERLAIAQVFGVRLPGIHQWLLDTYRLGGDTLAETFRRLTYEAKGPYQWTPTPKSMEHKYVTEDVPCGLVAMSALGGAVGVSTPVIDALIALSGAMLGRDFRKEGRNLESLGLAGKTAGEIMRAFELGPTTT